MAALAKENEKKMILIVVLSIVAMVAAVIALYQTDAIPHTGTGETVNRDTYTLLSFDLRESSKNALSTEKGKSQSMHLSYETIYLDVPETGGYKKIKLDETARKKLETDLLTLIEKHRLREWNGFDEHLQVMDASNSFSLRVSYKNEDKIVASGGFVFPDHYNMVFHDVRTVFVRHCS